MNLVEQEGLRCAVHLLAYLLEGTCDDEGEGTVIEVCFQWKGWWIDGKTSSQILENSSVECLWSFIIYGYLWWISHTSEYPSLQVLRLTNHSSLHRHEWLVTARPTGFGQISLEEARGWRQPTGDLDVTPKSLGMLQGKNIL